METKTVDYLMTAKNAQQQGNLINAQELLNKVMALEPQNLDAHLLQARIYFKEKKFIQAKAAVSFVSINQESADAAKVAEADFLYGKIQAVQGNIFAYYHYHLAHVYFDKAIELDPANSKRYYAEKHFTEGMIDQQLAELLVNDQTRIQEKYFDAMYKYLRCLTLNSADQDTKTECEARLQTVINNVSAEFLLINIKKLHKQDVFMVLDQAINKDTILGNKFASNIEVVEHYNKFIMNEKNAFQNKLLPLLGRRSPHSFFKDAPLDITKQIIQRNLDDSESCEMIDNTLLALNIFT